MNHDHDDLEPYGDRNEARAERVAAAEAATGVAAAALTVLALAALLGTGWRTVRHVHERRRSMKPPRLQTWEGEGGRPHNGSRQPVEGMADAAV